MTVAFAARRTPAGWRIRRVEPKGAQALSDAELDRFNAEGNVRLGAMLDRAAIADEAWRLEIEKSAFVHGLTALGVAEAFAARCVADPGAEHSVSGSPREVSAWSLMKALRAAGEPVSGFAGARAVVALRFLAAALVGLAGWTALARRGGGRLPPEAATVYAVHPEDTNRSTHLLRALQQEAPAAPLILLGRPTLTAGGVRDFLDRWKLAPASTVRPWDPAAAATALPAFFGRLGSGVRAMTASAYQPSFREQATMAFRLAMGLAARDWWRRQTCRPTVVVYGHCGRADTIPLERAQQAAGARTVHWLHGLSAGRIYRGVSDLLVAQCGHDARWHETLGGYAAALSLPSPRPVPGHGGAGWIVLSNFIHPAHPTFAVHGPRDELALMAMIATAAAAAGVRPADVLWKPHPVIYAMDAAIQDEAAAAMARHGFTAWQRGDRDFARVAGFGVVISTPSGAAVDVLRLGRLPVIAAPRRIDPDHVLAGFPLIAGDAGALCESIGRLTDRGTVAALFNQAWAAVEPGAVPALADLAAAIPEQVARSGGLGQRRRAKEGSSDVH